jgi:hypothetical protein
LPISSSFRVLLTQDEGVSSSTLSLSDCEVAPNPTERRHPTSQAAFSNMENAVDGFRVVVVGGGLSALLTAVTLEQAGIDYVVLERRKELDLDAGASVAVWPHNLRLFDQLSLLDSAYKTYLPVKYKRNLRRDGSELSRSNMLERAGTK